MKEVPCKPKDCNIYCTDADSIDHSNIYISAEQLLTQIKICSLIGKHIYVSAGHIYENPETHRLLSTYPELIRTGIVAIGLRNDCRDFKDLLEHRKLQGKSIKQQDSKLSTFLDINASAIIRWSPQKSQPLFQRELLSCIEDSHSILRRRLRGVRKEAIKRLHFELGQLQDFEVTRANLKRIAEKHIPNRLKAFMREVNLLYYVIGSRKNLKPHLSSKLFSDLNQGYFESIDKLNQSLPFDEILQESLREMFIPTELIAQMNISDLAIFREKYDKELQKFRHKWWRITTINDKEKLSASLSESLVHEITSLLTDAVSLEKKSLQRYKHITKWLGITSLITSGISLIPNPVLSAISFLVAIGVYSADQDVIKHSVLKTDFAALTTCLQSHIKSEKPNLRLHKNQS